MLDPQYRVTGYPVYSAYDGDDGFYFTVVVHVPPELFARFDDENERKTVEKIVSDLASHIAKGFASSRWLSVEFAPALRLVGDTEKPSGVFNNGRAHPANVASIEHDGFRFRSRAEVYVYRALKKRRILCSPLPVWSSPGPERTRLETDFIVCHQGGWMVLEIDGPSHTESPLDADERLRPFCGAARAGAQSVRERLLQR